MNEQAQQVPRVDLEQLRAHAARAIDRTAGVGFVWVQQRDLAALVAVVDAARGLVQTWSAGQPANMDALIASVKPFTPEKEQPSSRARVRDELRAWEEVDRWNAERDLAVKAAIDATKGNPRDRARDQLADAGVAVQRQFRSDQERIAELEAERDALRKELDARRADVRELETDAAATAGEMGEYEELVEKLKLELLEARKASSAAHDVVIAARDLVRRELVRGLSSWRHYRESEALCAAVMRLDGEKP